MTSPTPRLATAVMNVDILVPNSQSDSQTSNVQSIEDKRSFTSVTTIATPPSSQSPTPREAQDSFGPAPSQISQPARVSPTRPFTPSLEVPRSRSSSPSSRSSKSPIIGKKRTANGLIKNTNEAAMSSPATLLGSGRRESVSSAGRISELSKQLKTRLTYAMVKVQNGWEQHSIDQVENIVATQLSSPASLVNGIHRGKYQSPRDAMNSKNRRSRDLSLPMSAQANMASITSSAPPAGWSGYPRGAAGYGPVHNGVGSGLQPAPELTSAPRTYYADDRMSESSGSSGNMASRYASKPITHARTASLRANTPTQQEQDAIETLLGMSSPGPPTAFANSQTTSPKRAEFAVPQQHNRPGYGGSQVRRPSLVGSRSMSSEELDHVAESRRANHDEPERKAKRRSFGVLKSSKDVDDLLDQIAAAASSDEEEDNTASLRSQIPAAAAVMRS